MIDRKAVSKRFFSCYPGMSRSDVAKIMRVHRTTVSLWETKNNVPWKKLKYLSDSQAVSWDWLFTGREPKAGTKRAVMHRTPSPEFRRSGINRRFLSLFPGMTQTEIANVFGITPAAVNEWCKNTSQVSWKRLDYAAETFGVRWDWLIDGLQPKFRERDGDRHA